jgi:hypothetical protein
MLWGRFSYHANGPFVPVDGKMHNDRLVTRNVTERKKLGEFADTFLQQDVAPCHISKKPPKFYLIIK